jgi:glutaredoxin
MFKVFYISGCHYSSKTVDTLNNLKYKTDLILCNDREQCSQDIDYNEIVKTYKTFPKVFYKSKKHTFFIGGNQELQELLTLYNNLIADDKYNITSQRFINKRKTIYILSKLTKFRNKNN